MTDIRFSQKVSAALKGADILVVAAPRSALTAGWHRKALGARWAAELNRPAEDARPGDLGAVVGTYGRGKDAPRRIFVAALPDTFGRHNSPTRAEFLRHCLAQCAGTQGKKMAVIVHLDDPSHYAAAAVAVARCFPHYDSASSDKGTVSLVAITAATPQGKAIKPDRNVKATTEAVRLAARLVDTPPQDMKTDDLEKEARAAVKGLAGVKVTSIVGNRLLTKRMGGIHGVGRTALVPPRLVVLEYKPKGKARRTVALVGKGIIYDTGGLNIKVGGHMSNMKCDMGGAAAVLGAFLTLAKTGCRDRVYALLCLAENAVGPDSYRPDDILHLHSGRTVEINNTDAEGRLVLGDGVSYAARDLKADVILDAATLTGAQLIATGSIVAAGFSNRDGLESRAVAAGRVTGDLVHPLLFIPEFFKQEFKSKVADMRNSVSNRASAQSSCAAQFVYNHISDLNPPWMHFDIAGPAFRSGRGTGFGVALLAETVRTLKDSDLAS